jgi:hypothetical protein
MRKTIRILPLLIGLMTTGWIGSEPTSRIDLRCDEVLLRKCSRRAIITTPEGTWILDNCAITTREDGTHEFICGSKEKK